MIFLLIPRALSVIFICIFSSVSNKSIIINLSIILLAIKASFELIKRFKSTCDNSWGIPSYDNFSSKLSITFILCV